MKTLTDLLKSLFDVEYVEELGTRHLIVSLYDGRRLLIEVEEIS